MPGPTTRRGVMHSTKQTKNKRRQRQIVELVRVGFTLAADAAEFRDGKKQHAVIWGGGNLENPGTSELLWANECVFNTTI